MTSLHGVEPELLERVPRLEAVGVELGHHLPHRAHDHREDAVTIQCVTIHSVTIHGPTLS